MDVLGKNSSRSSQPEMSVQEKWNRQNGCLGEELLPFFTDRDVCTRRNGTDRMDVLGKNSSLLHRQRCL
jgi:hypothetical protein